ncbi:uncharacterized protein BP5553_05557 [Venustampulla echinocandica]|uniref:Uncharacterized protein n=1 Tax=Venustampulla echinocandica TaxID=2656787 RepID=A0A370TRJ5_9HELO|nr:uncharacterized protein BP5553_05557 [Venustampulla echinocandica]RDL38124.1 hypothetical protein BP5553_05557 [Venustampulla echinocandica]
MEDNWYLNRDASRRNLPSSSETHVTDEVDLLSPGFVTTPPPRPSPTPATMGPPPPPRPSPPLAARPKPNGYVCPPEGINGHHIHPFFTPPPCLGPIELALRPKPLALQGAQTSSIALPAVQQEQGCDTVAKPAFDNNAQPEGTKPSSNDGPSASTPDSGTSTGQATDSHTEEEGASAITSSLDAAKHENLLLFQRSRFYIAPRDSSYYQQQSRR